MTQRLRAPVSICLLNDQPEHARPAPSPGSDTSPSGTPACRAPIGRPGRAAQAIAMWNSSRQKYSTMASVVPSWMTAVNAVKPPGSHVRVEPGLHDAQVGGGGDRQELGQPLDDAVDDRRGTGSLRDSGHLRGPSTAARSMRDPIIERGGRRASSDQRGHAGLGELGHPFGDPGRRAQQRG